MPNYYEFRMGWGLQILLDILEKKVIAKKVLGLCRDDY